MLAELAALELDLAVLGVVLVVGGIGIVYELALIRRGRFYPQEERP